MKPWENPDEWPDEAVDRIWDALIWDGLIMNPKSKFYGDDLVEELFALERSRIAERLIKESRKPL